MLNAVIGGRKPPNFKAGMSRIAPALFLLGALLSALGMAEIFGGPQAAFGQSAPESVSSQTVSATLDYRHHKTCDMLGGTTETALDIAGKTAYICSEIDRVDTFCIVGHPAAQPCQGLFKHVVACNDKHNRPAENMFFCGKKCPDGYFACGDQCGHHGAINPPGRILYVPESYRGEIFRPTANVTLGMAKFRVEPSGSVMTVSDAGGMTMAVGVHAAVLAAGEYSATLRADFSCAGLAQESATVAADYHPFTITVFSPPPTLTIYFEAGEGFYDGGQPSIPGIKRLSLKIDAVDSKPSSYQGKIDFIGIRPPPGDVTIVQATGHSPEFLGSVVFSLRAEFHRPFSPVFGPDHCRTPDNWQELRRDAGCRPNISCRIDRDLLDSFAYDSDSLLCQALREGADTNYSSTAGNFRRGVSELYSLLLAAILDRVDIARTLTINGASTTMRANEIKGGGLLNHAVLFGAPNFTRWLLEEVGLNPRQLTGQTVRFNPVHRLAERNLGEDGDAAAVAALLVRHNADPNAPTDGWIDAKGASHNGNGPRAINIMTQDRDGGIPPDHRSLPVLLSAGLDASHVFPDRRGVRLSPLTHAAENNYVHVVSLLSTPKHVNQRSPDNGATPLHYASSEEAVSLLVAGGASLNYAPDIPGSAFQALTPLDAMVVWQLTTTLEFSHPDRTRQLFGLLYLNQMGGRCNGTYPPMTEGAALCMPLAARSPAGADASPSGVSALGRCGTPRAAGEPEAPFYESACHLECEAPGHESVRVGVRHCRSAANEAGWSWSRREAFRRSCESWAASESGLSCAHAEWRRAVDSNADGN